MEELKVGDIVKLVCDDSSPQMVVESFDETTSMATCKWWNCSLSGGQFMQSSLRLSSLKKCGDKNDYEVSVKLNENVSEVIDTVVDKLQEIVDLFDKVVKDNMHTSQDV
ncbi:MAG: hypothetical protein PHX80_03720 [Candidatus Nanoarchaeia archaeon]|nr:hypothetical protein [Candidatus Nanoarchaeia archaeon]